jgi:flagellar basal-body rod protein FlgG
VTRAGTIGAADGTVVPAGVQLGLGVRPAAVTVNFAQGSLTSTGGDLDIAIEGRGYLEVTLPSGVSAYTRDGALQRTGDGLIVTSDGYEVAPASRSPRMPGRSRSMPMGRSTPSFIDRVEPELLGRLSLSGFERPGA